MERLARAERRALGTIPERVDLARVRIHRGQGSRLARLVRAAVLGASGGRAVTLGNHVFLPDRACGDVATLAHELTHCGQYQAWGALRYFARGAAEQAADLVYRHTGRGRSPYQYTIVPGRPFAAYGMEQQGQIVEDCFRGDPVAAAVSPFHPVDTTDTIRGADHGTGVIA